MTFLPKKDLLTLEELDRLCSAFIAKGVRKLRLTGGEPLVRKNIMFWCALSRQARHRRARRADADHQRLAARALCR
jgi:cyclic pyranopterin phosphate synthase